VLASWGVDGHNSHTNVCSSGGRAGFQFWMGIDRPSPDHANAKVIYLISSHLEAGHYCNPHAQRITEARERGAKVVVLDTRLSNTATHADYWLSPQPGSEAAINLAVATEGGTFPNAWNKFVPRPIHVPPHPAVWQDLSWPEEFPLDQNELSFLLPHLLKDGRGKLDTYFIRVYNPVWTNPDGLSWMEVLTDESKVGCFVALTPTWNESAYFADCVLPMGHGYERRDTHSYEQYDGQWVGFRQPVLGAAAERLGREVTDTRQVNPGEVWEENEWWTELSWRIDPDGSMGIRQYHESLARPGEKLTVDEYYGWMFENSVPGLPERAAAEGHTPLQWMRRYGAFEISKGLGGQHESEVPADELTDVSVGPADRVVPQ
jgi:anaerobic selenocysteine-containing dehydrogenase